MIDFHSHILPGVDDGSQSVDESCSLLKELSAQGVGTVVATPHFNPDNETAEGFILRRNASYEMLKPHLEDEMPEVLLGAEVRYYQGISRLENLKSLCVQGSNLLLLELPMCELTEYTLRDILDITQSGITVVLAHIERYFGFFKSSVWKQILQSELLLQVNSDFFCDFPFRRKALKLLRNGGIHFIGSDCHNLIRRPPRINEAVAVIQKKLGKDFLEYINDCQNKILSNC